jgi:hypothetical protein
VNEFKTNPAFKEGRTKVGLELPAAAAAGVERERKKRTKEEREREREPWVDYI